MEKSLKKVTGEGGARIILRCILRKGIVGRRRVG
jgi:hypothetical protein